MNQTNKILFAVAVVVILGVIVWLARNQTPSASVSQELKIGVLAPLTGDVSVMGERMRNAMELAKAEVVEEDPGMDITIIYEDACFAKQTVNATQKLINVDKVPIIGGSFCLFGHVPILPITEENKIITFNTAANPDAVLNKRYAFSTNFSIKDDAKTWVEYATKELGAKSAATMHLNTPFGQDYDKYLSEFFVEAGGTMVAHEAAAPDARDFRAGITKIKEKNPDVVFAIHFGTPMGLFLKQAQEVGLDLPIIADYETEDPTIVNVAGPAAEGVIFSSTEVDKKFQQIYQERYGQLPDVIAANAYDAIKLQVMAFTECNGDPDCMAGELRKVKNYRGASGTLTIQPDGSTQKPKIFKTIRNGQFVTIDE